MRGIPLSALTAVNPPHRFWWAHKAEPRVVPYDQLRPGDGYVCLDDKLAYIVCSLESPTPVMFIFDEDNEE